MSSRKAKMKARTKITLWTASFTLLAGMLFSGFVFFEMMEQPIRLVDRELEQVGDVLTQTLNSADQLLEISSTIPARHPFDRYWIRIGNKQATLFASAMAKEMDIPSRSDQKFYFAKKSVPLKKIWIAQEDNGEIDDITGDIVPFRVMVNQIKIDGIWYPLLIAKPIPILMGELTEVVFDTLLGMLAFTFMAIAGSYYLGGKFLQPLASINTLIKDINDNSLDKRISLGKNHDELYVLARSLNGMFDRLHYSFHRQSEFIANAAHELKSPLTILLLGHEEMLSGSLSPAVRARVEKHINTLRRLAKLVQNLLKISRLEQLETLQLETVLLTDLINHVIEEFADILQVKNISLDTHLESVSFAGDKEKILQMLINLFDNAIKYNTAENGHIWITTQQTQECIRFTIANSGLQISEEDQPKIFDQFFRVEKSRSAMFGGSGLGLTIVKKIVALHHGRISVTSTSAGVTRFTVDFS